MFHEHSKVDPADARVRFVGLGASSLDLEMFAYIKAAGMPEFLGIQEDLLLRIMDIVAKSGTGIAFPSQTTYVGKDERFDPQKTGEAEMQVRAWREKNKLADHDFYVEPVNQANDPKL